VTKDHVVGEWKNVLLTGWRGDITVAGLEVTRVASHDLHGRYPDGLVVFNVVRTLIPVPDSPVRHKASAVLAETAGHVLCTATVIEGEGFWASAARAVVATITLVSRASHPHKVFATIEESADWAEPYVVDGGPRAAELATAAAALFDLT
jgi:hypothetical protein